MHRIVKDAWVQIGDVEDGSGAHSPSASGGSLRDESFTLKHSQKGVVSMASDGPHTGGSQFFITLKELPSLDGKCVAFGQVVSGLHTLSLLNDIPLRNQRPIEKVILESCSELTVAAAEANAQAARPGSALPQDEPVLEATITVLGLDNSGKTILVKNFLETPLDQFYSSPTHGFEREDTEYGSFDVTFFGVGGAANIRGIWPHYFDQSFAFIYVIDAADKKRLPEAKVGVLILSRFHANKLNVFQ